jgi:ABC-2 type transport system ATP-binding protein
MKCIILAMTPPQHSVILRIREKFQVNETILTVKDFRKTYGNFVAVDGISFEVHRGEIFGLLGPNGAGKTTTLECLEGLRQPNGGTLDILGLNPGRDGRNLRNLVGVQLQTSALPGTMTANEAMTFMCAYHGVAPRADLLQRLGLGDKHKTQYAQLSTGLQRRLSLALAVAHRPPVLFLDEPTAGLDVESRTELHALTQELKDAGASILLATHDMAEAEKMADRVAILLTGKIVVTGTPRELTATGSAYTKVSVRTERSALFKNNTNLPAVSQHAFKEDYATYLSTDPGATVSAILAHISAQGDKLIDLRVERPSLEERFLEITTIGGAP